MPSKEELAAKIAKLNEGTIEEVIRFDKVLVPSNLSIGLRDTIEPGVVISRPITLSSNGKTFNCTEIHVYGEGFKGSIGFGEDMFDIDQQGYERTKVSYSKLIDFIQMTITIEQGQLFDVKLVGNFIEE